MTSSMACPCGVAVLGIVEAATAQDAIAAYERAAFQALAVGAQLHVRRHAAEISSARAAEEIDDILRRLRIALALMEKQVAEDPPTNQSPGALAGYLRSWAHTTGQITAQLYRQAAHQDTATSADQLGGGPAAPGSTTAGGAR
ncbi:hypothetical protein [Amycolatopsis nalaikhensis]|uniref:Uncharacterized protein n=1 Tax=Amycolatopsis nalaikhensis TaxID=715472 RepID=A0ABY8XYA1_9PSEU|nr:hypothetical protein [Amycolatopsis sp. 2-2]WIV60680.1 hypothetical protein QP939_19740 [Amycolatopsis sp. 2-2]